MPAVRHDRPRQHVRRGASSTQKAVEAGVKPIIGCEIYVAPKSRFEKDGPQRRLRGGRQLPPDPARHEPARATGTSAGSSPRATREGFHYKPRDRQGSSSRELNGGLIALSGCLPRRGAHSLDHRAQPRARAAAARKTGASIFDERYYVEIQDNQLAAQERVNVELIALAQRARPAARRHQRLPLPRTPTTPRRTRSCSASRREDASPTKGAGSSGPTSST